MGCALPVWYGPALALPCSSGASHNPHRLCDVLAWWTSPTHSIGTGHHHPPKGQCLDKLLGSFCNHQSIAPSAPVAPLLVMRSNSKYFSCQMTVHLFSPDNRRGFRRRCFMPTTWNCLWHQPLRKAWTVHTFSLVYVGLVLTVESVKRHAPPQ